jgi:acyl-CoA hydrolase
MSVLGGLATAQPRVVVSGNFATPRRALALLDETVESYRVFALNAQDLPRCRADVVMETPFVGAGMRDASTLEYLPMRLSLVPLLFLRGRPPDVVVLNTSTPRAGKVSLGIEVNILPAAIAAARHRGGLVIAQLNRHMPYTRGDGEIELDAIDLAIEADDPLLTCTPGAIAEHDMAIGARISGLIDDGATLQLGIGRIPDSVLLSLGQHRELGIWSEMISDGVLDLERSGVLATDRPITASFLFGSPELYEWVDDNERVRLLCTETVNDPARIARNRTMTSINTAMQFDLFGQANASYAHGRIYSGFGGQPDFVEGSLHSRGGHSVIALRSWHDKSQSSTIVPALSTPATSFQHSMVVTENGCAEIFGRSQKAQVRLLIEETARPDARDSLWEAARKLQLAYPTPSDDA